MCTGLRLLALMPHDLQPANTGCVSYLPFNKAALSAPIHCRATVANNLQVFCHKTQLNFPIGTFISHKP